MIPCQSGTEILSEKLPEKVGRPTERPDSRILSANKSQESGLPLFNLPTTGWRIDHGEAHPKCALKNGDCGIIDQEIITKIYE